MVKTTEANLEIRIETDGKSTECIEKEERAVKRLEEKIKELNDSENVDMLNMERNILTGYVMCLLHMRVITSKEYEEIMTHINSTFTVIKFRLETK